MRFYALGFGLLLGFDTLAQTCFKLAGEHALPVELDASWLLRVFQQPSIYGALLGYVGAFVCWLSLLRRAPIGPAFAASHLELVTVMVVAHQLFGEALTVPRLLGAGLIFAGVLCLAYAERDASGELASVPVDGSGDTEATVDAPAGTRLDMHASRATSRSLRGA